MEKQRGRVKKPLFIRKAQIRQNRETDKINKTPREPYSSLKNSSNNSNNNTNSSSDNEKRMPRKNPLAETKTRIAATKAIVTIG